MKLQRLWIYCTLFTMIVLFGTLQSTAYSADSQSYYYVYAGSFKNKQNAVKRERALEAKGFDAFVKKAWLKGETWYRVQVGAFNSQSNAKSLANQVRNAGFDGVFIISPSQKPSPIYGVYAGSYLKSHHAFKQQNKLANLGYSSSITVVKIDGKKWYRVEVGTFSSYTEAKAFAKQLKKKVDGVFIAKQQ
jgi:cell division protein FtsN